MILFIFYKFFVFYSYFKKMIKYWIDWERKLVVLRVFMSFVLNLGLKEEKKLNKKFKFCSKM